MLNAKIVLLPTGYWYQYVVKLKLKNKYLGRHLYLYGCFAPGLEDCSSRPGFRLEPLKAARVHKTTQHVARPCKVSGVRRNDVLLYWSDDDDLPWR